MRSTNAVEKLLKESLGSRIVVHDFSPGYGMYDKELFWGYGEKEQWYVWRTHRGYPHMKQDGVIYMGSDFAEAVRHLNLKEE